MAVEIGAVSAEDTGAAQGNCKDNNHYHFPSASLHTSPDSCVPRVFQEQFRNCPYFFSEFCDPHR